MEYKFLKIADLANKLDAEDRILEANSLDLVLSQAAKLSSRLKRIEFENHDYYLKNSQAFIRLAHRLEKTLTDINSKESQAIIKEIKEAGPGSFFNGLKNVITAPFSGMGNWFKDIIDGSKFKAILDEAVKNLETIHSLMDGGKQDQALAIIKNDATKMWSLLKEAFGEFRFRQQQQQQQGQGQQQQGQGQQQQPQQTDPNIQQSDHNAQQGQQALAMNLESFIKESQSLSGVPQGTLSLMQHLWQLISSLGSGTADQSVNMWTGILSSLSATQPEKRKDPSGGYGQGGGGGFGVGGGYGQGGGGGFGGIVSEQQLLSEFGDIKGIDLREVLKRISNSKKESIAMRKLRAYFPNRYPGTLAGENKLLADARAARKVYHPKDPAYPDHRKWDYQT